MLRLIRNAALVMTDSGGLQKEAYFFSKFCITLREETEWTELVRHGYNRVCGSARDLILQSFKEFMTKSFSQGKELYGGGKAAPFIADKLMGQ